MLKINTGIFELYSHWMEADQEWSEEELNDFIEEHEVKSFEELLEKMEASLIGDYKNGMLDLKGNTGNGSWYEGNEDNGHDNLRVEFDYPEDLEEKLKPYFVV